MSDALDIPTGLYVARPNPIDIDGRVTQVSGLSVCVADRLAVLQLKARVAIETVDGDVLAEVVAVGDGSAIAVPFARPDGIRCGDNVRFLSAESAVAPCEAWLGRIVDGLGRPIDDKGPLPFGPRFRSLRGGPPVATRRARLGETVSFGVRAVDLFMPVRRGQRMGVFSGAGVGKSSLLAMIAKNMECDVAIIALVGERGREVREFVEDHLGADGLSRSIVIAETADAPAMMRREVGYLAHTLAEHFRDNGAHVLCLMDSITRIAIAQREIGLAAGEPPTAKGYTPSVFSTLSALIERSGPGSDGPQPGFITAIYSVLVEGDDIDEPVADAARSILDGHIVLDRTLAQSGQFPPIDIQRSVSRTASAASTPDELKTSNRARKLAAIYENTRELVRIGAYKAGSDPETDRAIAFYPRLAALLTQSINQCADPTSAFLALDEIIKEVEMAYE